VLPKAHLDICLIAPMVQLGYRACARRQLIYTNFAAEEFLTWL